MKFSLCVLLLISIITLSFAQSNSFEDFLGTDENVLQHSVYSKDDLMEVRRQFNLTFDVDPDEDLTVPELLNKYGYPAEEHFVETEDGYILRMHRIPPTKDGITPCNKTIFLMHGLLSSSADWVILGPQKAFAYLLADRGYDVWMGNARGNTYSRNHSSINPNRAKFWKFSWHEIGIYDLPAMIDYILQETNQKALYYSGHSQGTTSFYVMCSEKPEYNDKIIAQFSLAPVAIMQHTFSPIFQVASKFWYPLQEAFEVAGVNEFLPHSDFMTWVSNHFCRADEMPEILCKNFLFLLCGFDKDEFNATVLPVLLAHTPAGSSVRQFFHYAQNINSRDFHKYNYAPMNAVHYGPLHPLLPPSYTLKNIKAPVYLYYSKNDWLSSPKDVAKLCKNIKNCKAQVLIAEAKFNHLDYVWGMHAKEMVYNVVISDIENHL